MTNPFPRCEHSPCEESALSFSKSCWNHVDQGAYLVTLKEAVGRMDPGVPQALNLKKVECEGLDLSHLSLKGSILGQVKMSRCTLIGADLSEANLIGASLSRCDFVGADLSRASLTQSFAIPILWGR